MIKNKPISPQAEYDLRRKLEADYAKTLGWVEVEAWDYEECCDAPHWQRPDKHLIPKDKLRLVQDDVIMEAIARYGISLTAGSVVHAGGIRYRQWTASCQTSSKRIAAVGDTVVEAVVRLRIKINETPNFLNKVLAENER